MSGQEYPGLYSPYTIAEKIPGVDQKSLGGFSPRLFSSLIVAMSYVLDLQDDPQLYHGWRVAAVATAMAQQIMPEQVTDVFFASLLHDIGVMGQFSHIVHYPIRHAQEASPEIVAHPHRGAEIVHRIPGLELASSIIADHHEWWDGGGYPSQKAGEDIPLAAQLIRIADTADINKKLQSGSSAEQAIEMAKLFADIEIGPDIVDAFESVILQKEFYRELTDEAKLLQLIYRLESDLPFPIFRRFSDVTGNVLTTFAKMVDSKHNCMEGHSERVALYALNLARIMDLQHDDITKVRFAGLVHDAGKVSVPNSIIDKPGPLDSTELFKVKHHPVLTMSVIGNIACLTELAQIACHHHEHWDGTGYPDGLLGPEIPLSSRILAVADAMDAITSPRSYRRERSTEEALTILRQAAGSQFDPQVVEAADAVWE